MPKLRNRDPDADSKLKLQAWLAAGMAMKGIKSYEELANRAGMNPRTLIHRKLHPETMRMGEIWSLTRIIGGMRDDY